MKYSPTPLWALLLAGGVLLAPMQSLSASHYDVFFNAGDAESYTGFSGLKSIKPLDNGFVFASANVATSNKGNNSLGLGLGYRTLGQNSIYGLYGSLDAQMGKSEYTHHQVSLGGERLGQVWDARINAHIPTSKAKEFGSFTIKETTEDAFSGNKLQSKVTGFTPSGFLTEEAMTTVDAEIGALIPNDRELELRGYIGSYFSTAKYTEDAVGGRIRLEALPTDNFKVDFSLSYDELFEARGSLNLSLALGKKATTSGVRPLQDRITQPIYRQVGLKTTDILDTSKRTAYNGDQSTVGTVRDINGADNIAHINNDPKNVNTNATKGTVENPFTSISECQQASTGVNCNNSEIIYIHTGKSVTLTTSNNTTSRASNQNDATPYVGNIALKENQSLVGDGAETGTFKNVASGFGPVLVSAEDKNSTTPTAIITMNNNTLLQGVRLGWHFGFNDSQTTSQMSTKDLATGQYMSNYGVFAQDKQGVNIKDVGITGYVEAIDGKSNYDSTRNFDTGIYIKATNGTSTTVLRNVIVQASLNDGLKVEAIDDASTNASGEDITQTVNAYGLGLLRNGRGARLTAQDNNASTGTINQVLAIRAYEFDNTVSKSVIQQSNNEGVLVDSTNTGTNQTVANQILTIDNAQINDNVGAGVFADFAKSQGNQTGTTGSKLSINETFIYRNEGGGVAALSSAGTTDILIEDTQIFGNIAKKDASFYTDLQDNVIGFVHAPLGQTLNGDAIEGCGSTSANTCETARKVGQGIGLYAKNTDDGTTASVQNIELKNFATYQLHNKAQMYVEAGTSHANSKQTLNIQNIENLSITDTMKLAGQYNNQGLLETQTGTSVPVVAHDDGVTGCTPSTQVFENNANDYVTIGSEVDTQNPCTEKEHSAL